VEGSVLTKVQLTVLGPVADHVVPKLGLVTVMARADEARESRGKGVGGVHDKDSEDYKEWL